MGLGKNEMKQTKPLDYSVDIAPEYLVRTYTNKWVLEWCRKYHPEAFEEANKFVKDYLTESQNYNSVEELEEGWNKHE